MNPEYIVIVVEDQHRSNVVCATIAYSQDEANSIASKWHDGHHYTVIVSCDYSMRES